MTKNKPTEHSDINETIKRVEQMEQCFDILLAAVQSDAQTVYLSPKLNTLLTQLRRYYEGGQWLRDYEMDEQGLLPPDLKRGVLSQDAVFDLLSVLGPAQNGTDTPGEP